MAFSLQVWLWIHLDNQASGGNEKDPDFAFEMDQIPQKHQVFNLWVPPGVGIDFIETEHEVLKFIDT